MRKGGLDFESFRIWEGLVRFRLLHDVGDGVEQIFRGALCHLFLPNLSPIISNLQNIGQRIVIVRCIHQALTSAALAVQSQHG